MTLTLTPTTETKLLALAAQRGQAPEEIIDALIQREAGEDDSARKGELMFSAAQPDPTLALFAQWAEEDKTDDPEEIARRQREGDELLANLQANRLSLRRVDVSGEGWD
jgi:hypothetical protein